MHPLNPHNDFHRTMFHISIYLKGRFFHFTWPQDQAIDHYLWVGNKQNIGTISIQFRLLHWFVLLFSIIVAVIHKSSGSLLVNKKLFIGYYPIGKRACQLLEWFQSWPWGKRGYLFMSISLHSCGRMFLYKPYPFCYGIFLDTAFIVRAFLWHHLRTSWVFQISRLVYVLQL